MLASGKMAGFVPTKDYEKARAFYESKLGFEFVRLDQYALVLRAGGHMIRITKLPEYTPLQATILGWEVESIEAASRWLRERGVETDGSQRNSSAARGRWKSVTASLPNRSASRRVRCRPR